MPESLRHPIVRTLKAIKRDVQRARMLVERSERRLDVLLRLKVLTTDRRAPLRDDDRAHDAALVKGL